MTGISDTFIDVDALLQKSRTYINEFTRIEMLLFGKSTIQWPKSTEQELLSAYEFFSRYIDDASSPSSMEFSADMLKMIEYGRKLSNGPVNRAIYSSKIHVVYQRMRKDTSYGLVDREIAWYIWMYSTTDNIRMGRVMVNFIMNTHSKGRYAHKMAKFAGKDRVFV